VCGSYTINDGDTFWKISQARGVSVQGIMNVNPGVVPEKLRIGQTINLPCAGGGELAL
jgi:LysM repeat protein